MNGLDLLLCAAALLAAVGGWRLGLITRGIGWVGLALGLAAGILLVPRVTGWLNPPSDAALLLLGAGCVIVLASGGQAIGVAVGSRLRPEPSSTLGHTADRVGGAILGVVGVVVLLWLMVPLMGETSGSVAAVTRGSLFARTAADRLPEPPPQIAELRRSLMRGDYPQLFAGLRPAPDLPSPPEGSPLDAAALDVVARSVARVRGEACSSVQSGSAFSVGTGLWVTNAHVVAGTGGVDITAVDGTSAPAEVVWFDPRADVAVLRSSLERPPLQFGEPGAGGAGLVLGFPGGGPFDPSPFLVGEELDATGYDIYDRDLVRRRLVVLASELAPGDSGSAVVDEGGAVVGAAVAIAPDRAGVAYALHPDTVAEALDRALDGGPGAAADTGPCLR